MVNGNNQKTCGWLETPHLHGGGGLGVVPHNQNEALVGRGYFCLQ